MLSREGWFRSSGVASRGWEEEGVERVVLRKSRQPSVAAGSSVVLKSGGKGGET